MKTLLKSVHIYQSYCKKNLAQFFLAHPVCILCRLSATDKGCFSKHDQIWQWVNVMNQKWTLLCMLRGGWSAVSLRTAGGAMWCGCCCSCCDVRWLSLIRCRHLRWCLTEHCVWTLHGVIIIIISSSSSSSIFQSSSVPGVNQVRVTFYILCICKQSPTTAGVTVG